MARKWAVVAGWGALLLGLLWAHPGVGQEPYNLRLPPGSTPVIRPLTVGPPRVPHAPPLSGSQTSCSPRAVAELGAREDYLVGQPTPLCQDFARYGVMIFLSKSGSGMHQFVVYRRANGQWVRVNHLEFDNTETLNIRPDGDLLGQNRFDHRLWRWNGQKFTKVREACTYMTWDGADFVLKAYPCEGGVKAAATGDPCWRLAEEAGRGDAGELDCSDFTGTGKMEIAVTLPREPCDGCVTAQLLGKFHGTWRILFSDFVDSIRPGKKGGFAAAARELYRFRDSLASGPDFAEVRATNGKTLAGNPDRWTYFRWNGSRFTPTRNWLEKTKMTKGSCANPIGMW